MQKTYLAKTGEVKRGWVVVDLAGKVLGRAATEIAMILRGKRKVTFTPHIDTGDFVVAINAAKVRLTGDKLKKKFYYHYTGYIGGIKEVSAERLLAKNPAELIRRAVHGMLPKNNSNKHLMKKLRIFTGAEHPHAAQQPQAVTLPMRKLKVAEAKVPKHYDAIGKRKTAIASVALTPGEGKIAVNGREFPQYFGRAALQLVATQPFEATNTKGQFDVRAKITGGGPAGQADALKYAIAKALLRMNPDYKRPLRIAELLTRDARIVERKKYGKRGARRGTQYSKR